MIKNQAVPILYSTDAKPTGIESPRRNDIKNEKTTIIAKAIKDILPILFGGIAIQIW